MTKHLFNKCLLTAVAMIATMTCQSCQSRSSSPAQPKKSSQQVTPPSSQFNCDESEEGCNVEESGEEAMIQVIEIDAPEASNITEEVAPVAPVMEASTEVGAVPAEAPVVDTASVVPVPSSEAVSAPAAVESISAIAVQEVEAVSQEQKTEQE